MKLTFLQIRQAFNRVAWGESSRAVARDLDVTEGALRFHFRKTVHPRYIRQVAVRLLYAEQARYGLTAGERDVVDRLVAKERAKLAL